jgi:outer membrane protein OmpA-like peptidoglycan-associated protein
MSCAKRSTNGPTLPNEFQTTLASYYTNYSDINAQRYDWSGWDFFRKKAAKLEKGKNSPPEVVSDWNVPKASIAELDKARLVLTSLISREQETVVANPKATAEAQFYFDCWIEQEVRNWPVNDINYCKLNFYNSIKTLIARIDAEKEFINYANDIHSIFFKLNSSTIEESSILRMKKLISELQKVKTSLHIVLFGYTDRVGKEKYNYVLSQKRINTVKNILINSGVIKNDDITTKAFGENDKLISIDTIMNNPHSRRVDVFLYKK